MKTSNFPSVSEARKYAEALMKYYRKMMGLSNREGQKVK